MSARAAALTEIGRVKLIMLWGVALLWLLDTALQAQPGMFTIDFVSMIMKPSIAETPSFLLTLSNWTLGVVSAHITIWNLGFVAIQLAIASSLIAGLLRRDQRLVRAGLVLSIVWGLGVWVFAEGTSGVLTGNGTMLTGAPGAVLLYVAIAVLYLLPERWWRLTASFCLPRDFLAMVFLYGAVAQVVTPGFWGPRGTAVLIEGQASMAPPWMVNSMIPLVTFSHSNPVLANAILAAALLAVGVLLFGRAPKLAGFLLLGLLLAVFWYWGQAFGGVFSGMGTDPGTPPLLALLAVPAALAWRDRRRRTPQVAWNAPLQPRGGEVAAGAARPTAADGSQG